jgi:hypothetical protein
MKRCFKCNTQLADYQANYNCDVLDRIVDRVDERGAEAIGDQIITGNLPDEYFDMTQGIERTVLCAECTLVVVNVALRDTS